MKKNMSGISDFFIVLQYQNFYVRVELMKRVSLLLLQFFMRTIQFLRKSRTCMFFAVIIYGSYQIVKGPENRY